MYKALATSLSVGYLVAAYYLARGSTQNRTDPKNRHVLELIVIRFGPAISPILLLAGEFSEPVAARVIINELRGSASLAIATVSLAVGVILLVWSRVLIGRNFDPQLRIKASHVLVSAGPYRFVRHPIYLAYIIIWLALFLMFNNLIFSGFTAIFVARTLFRIPAEERMMKQAFGQAYDDYREHTYFVLPYLI